ncbi:MULTISPECIES: glycosyltransferase family 4 protein [Spirulina sp. CCY15215]|uniref:glycosyltransferase family 4 protein n=1 Tax=Spirulina sp. CCY15215 TaxID=2767591 RepID=UPI001950BBFA|nr:glycosyltransferase family 4 protein [Spirulina major]
MPNDRIAWLIPSVELGAYWQPVLQHFTKAFENTIFYTGQVWPNFDAKMPGASAIQIVGKADFVETQKVETGYGRGFIIVSPQIIFYLLKYKPRVVLPQAFSLWTLLSVLFKTIGGWKIVLIYDGSSPNTDFRDSTFRTFARRWLAQFADAFVANSHAGERYLLEALKVPKNKIFVKTYLVPDADALQKQLTTAERPNLEGVQQPIFLYVGRITQRKGLKTLLKACGKLRSRGYDNYTLLIVGTGDQKVELEQLIAEEKIKDRIRWEGWVEYGRLGAYFQQSDVFVFPTYEDVWGMVVPEAMVFGKPILCSKGAAAAELIVEGENGYIFDPLDPEELAEKMQYFLDRPDLIDSMGRRSQEIIAHTTPETAAQGFVDVISQVLKQ